MIPIAASTSFGRKGQLVFIRVVLASCQLSLLSLQSTPAAVRPADGRRPDMGFRGYWDAHEEDLLRRGVQKHGIGSWERIRHDPEFKVLKCVSQLARS